MAYRSVSREINQYADQVSVSVIHSFNEISSSYNLSSDSLSGNRQDTVWTLDATDTLS